MIDGHCFGSLFTMSSIKDMYYIVISRSMEFTFGALVALVHSNMCTSQVSESFYHGNRDIPFVTLLFEGSWHSYLGNVFVAPVGFYSTICFNENHAAMATEKYLYDCATRWPTQLFSRISCAEIITSMASC